MSLKYYFLVFYLYNFIAKLNNNVTVAKTIIQNLFAEFNIVKLLCCLAFCGTKGLLSFYTQAIPLISNTI